MLGIWSVNERVIMCKIHAKPFDLIIIQIFAPTYEHSDEDIELFYEDIERTCKQTKSTDTFLMGGQNAKVGKGNIAKSWKFWPGEHQ